MESPSPLVELTNVKQTEAGIFRRVFIDGDNDLTVWYDLDKKLIGFQLSIFDIAMTFNKNRLEIQRIDFCEKDNYAPILKEQAEIDLTEVIAYLKNNNVNIDKELMDYIFSAIEKADS